VWACRMDSRGLHSPGPGNLVLQRHDSWLVSSPLKRLGHRSEPFFIGKLAVPNCGIMYLAALPAHRAAEREGALAGLLCRCRSYAPEPHPAASSQQPHKPSTPSCPPAIPLQA
jgi:hypothetical protein